VLVFVSAFTSGSDGAIHGFQLDIDSGQLTQVHRTINVENPFFVAVSANKKFLYSTHAPGEFSGEGNNEIAAYRISGEYGALLPLNRRSVPGSGACYIGLDAAGKMIAAANYGTGSVVSLALQKDGSLLDVSSFIQHIGSSVDIGRQSVPHPHCIVFSPDDRFAFSADLGADRIQSYRIESDSSQLVRNDPLGVDTHAGSGPRHLIFHPDGRHAYVTNELSSSIAVFHYDPEIGALKEQQMISMLPDGVDGDNYAADLTISPDGRFLYGSNRGHDSIAVYRIGEDGGLVVMSIESSCGESPQSLAITPCGTLLLCANMVGSCIAVFRIDSKTGRLASIGKPIEMPYPSCIAIR